jgi:DNA-directed RNA polymerase specialized sigma24 family protein
MAENILIQDKSLAQKICQALLAGNRQPLEELVTCHQRLFLPFARRRLFLPEDVEDVLQNFWEEMMNGKAICNYARQPESRISLRSFCLGILNRRIIDRNRQLSRERQRLTPEDATAADPGESPEDLLGQAVSDNLARSLVHAALIKLAERYPQDVELLRWHLDGLNYEDMAKKLLDPDQTTAVAVAKKINAVKKQFTREGSGSLTRFKAVLQELMRARGLNWHDF